MSEGTIKWVNTDKGFGFINAEDTSGDYFFHKSYLVENYRFDSLKEGDSVEFKLRPGKKRADQQEAYDIKPAGGTSAVHVTIRSSDPRHQSNERTVLPYGFAPIFPDKAVADIPVLHDGSSGGDLLSGEILCELQALTPLLPGNARYPVSDADRKCLQQWGFGELKEGKQIAEPLRLPDGRVVIAGTALKGMIRQSLGALTSAPMERVGERHFTYRPNLDFNKYGVSERYVVRPARVVETRDGGWNLDVFDDARAALFVRRDAVKSVRDAVTDDNQVSGRIARVAKEKNRVVASTGSEFFKHRLATYQGGIDGQGLLAASFNDGRRGPFTYDLALVPQEADLSLHLSADLYQRYLSDQEHVLADDKNGHLTGHPLGSKFDVQQVARSIRTRCEFSPGQLIYVELTTDSDGKVTKDSRVVSCGHHFRYRWAYTSSIREVKGHPRACLTPLADERTADKPERLTGARLLFGYVRDKTNPIGEGAFERLAGRIAINHAVSEGTPRFLGDPDKGYCIPLKILGQPKPSAWELYLQQPKDPKQRLHTYGDLPGDPGGELAGRKFYRHQPGTSQADIAASEDDIIASDQATLARFISQPGTRFRFAIRFARLRAWELGALLAVLEPHRLAPEGTVDEFAHKLGLGRPMGMGSVRISRRALRVRQEKEPSFPNEPAADETLSEAIRTLREKLDDDLLRQWLDAHRIVPGQRLGYPLAATKVDGKMVQTIYAWHTDVRRQYSQLRRQESPNWPLLANKITRER
ncbi:MULTISPECIES: TIGR03986 family CRISPR-associated RAMP protein [unclassified Thiocapsa]|uniref:TIGR03986 family type III CRISPR-associated RAMP protein n=1 Tax=unclassified Thiocapsa TaxID=2641286 RepID=UPI0035B29C3B